MASPELDIYEGPMAGISALSVGVNPDAGVAKADISTPPPVIVDPDPDEDL